MQWTRQGIELRPCFLLKSGPVFVCGKADVAFEYDLGESSSKDHEGERFANTIERA